MRTTLWRAAATAVLFLTLPLAAQVPEEVPSLGWCSGSKDCLSWPAVAGATGYNVYLGRVQDLPGLVDGTIDSCSFGQYATTTTGSVVGDPAPGVLDWFLVTAVNGSGEGSAGQGSFGPRIVDSSGACLPIEPVLNEVDYDQPGSDTGEFVEIYNGATAGRDLSDLVLIFVNGLSSLEYSRVELSEAGSTLPAGGYLVVGTADVVASLPAGTLSVTFPSSSNNVQNGAPDGIALFDTGTLTLVDALSYEGSITNAQFDGVAGTFNLVEGTAATAQDSNTNAGSLVRFPDGTDTDDADADWEFVDTPTPGSANPDPSAQ